MPRIARSGCCTLVFGVLVLSEVAQGGVPPAVSPALLCEVVDADPLELARLVDRHGDAIVLRGLDPKQPGRVRLAAVRAAPWMDAPAAALRMLAPLVTGRDSELAPAAARAIVRIVERVDVPAWFDGEAPGELDGLVRALERAGAQDGVRADLRLMAAQSVSMLGGVRPDAGAPERASRRDHRP